MHDTPRAHGTLYSHAADATPRPIHCSGPREMSSSRGARRMTWPLSAGATYVYSFHACPLRFPALSRIAFQFHFCTPRSLEHICECPLSVCILVWTARPPARARAHPKLVRNPLTRTHISTHTHTHRRTQSTHTDRHTHHRKRATSQSFSCLSTARLCAPSRSSPTRTTTTSTALPPRPSLTTMAASIAGGMFAFFLAPHRTYSHAHTNRTCAQSMPP